MQGLARQTAGRGKNLLQLLPGSILRGCTAFFAAPVDGFASCGPFLASLLADPATLDGRDPCAGRGKTEGKSWRYGLFWSCRQGRRKRIPPVQARFAPLLTVLSQRSWNIGQSRGLTGPSAGSCFPAGKGSQAEQGPAGGSLSPVPDRRGNQKVFRIRRGRKRSGGVDAKQIGAGVA